MMKAADITTASTSSDGGNVHQGIRSFVNRIRAHSLKSRNKATGGSETDSIGTALSRKQTPPMRSHCRRHSTDKRNMARDARTSLGLWNAAYDALRDDPVTYGLVVAYEGIISQELPDHLKSGGMNMSFRGRSDHERLELLTSITEGGLEKRRGSKASQVDDAARVVIDMSKDTIASTLVLYPSAAVAWSGICTLTPLMLDPILRLNDMRRGILHIIGRVAWYMSLTTLLSAHSWASRGEFKERQDETHDKLAKLYRKILEFEMNCICAAASGWNAAAKNVVGWNGLGPLVETIIGMDAQFVQLMQDSAESNVRDNLMRCNKDLEITPSAEADALRRLATTGPERATVAN